MFDHLNGTQTPGEPHQLDLAEQPTVVLVDEVRKEQQSSRASAGDKNSLLNSSSFMNEQVAPVPPLTYKGDDAGRIFSASKATKDLQYLSQIDLAKSAATSSAAESKLFRQSLGVHALDSQAAARRQTGSKLESGQK